MEFNDMLHGWTVRGDLADPLIKRSVSGNIISGVPVPDGSKPGCWIRTEQSRVSGIQMPVLWIRILSVRKVYGLVGSESVLIFCGPVPELRSGSEVGSDLFDKFVWHCMPF